MSFQDDIQGQNTQLYPVVKIGEDYYSTNNVTIDGNYCKPILMNIPTIKESIDIESRKFKISNVSLEFNNFPFDGVRFSDQLAVTSLINTEATIYFKSPSDLQEVYKGIIRRISHDDSKVSVELEDSTEQKAHKDLPQALDQNGVVGYLSDGDGILDKYKNQPIPMVYGHVDRSPLVITDNFREFIIDSKDISGFNSADSGFNNVDGSAINYGALYIDADGKYVNVTEADQYISEDSSIKLNASNPILFPDIVSSDGLEYLNCLDGNNDFNFTVRNSIYSDTLQNEDFFDIGDINKITDGKNEPNLCSIHSDPIDTELEVSSAYSLNGREKLFIDFAIKYEPNYNYVDGSLPIIGFKMNGINLPKVIENLAPSDYADYSYAVSGTSTKIEGVGGDNISETSEHYDQFPHMGQELAHDELRELFGFYVGGQTINPDAAIMLNYTNSSSGVTHSDENGVIVFYAVPANKTFNIQYRGVYNLTHQGDVGVDDFTFAPHFEMTGDFKEISLLREVKATKPFSKDFYANVKGRINTFDDHPDEPADDFIENPIDIIYDLVRSELGHDAINESEYTEAKLAHVDWKFGFTVNKKISSKKLIEDIAKSTKCFPKFKNDGTFGFNTIKDNYDVDNNYAGATPIKESEVISYSFKKTKPEQIYKKVTVSYNKDYAQDSYLKTALSEDLGADPYYGIENSSDAHLQFESDYIRDKDTADDLVSFLSEQYKNDHLLFNLKLPLQYINLEIGDLVKFEDLFQDLTAYGIIYTEIFEVNSQYRYPLFMVTSTTKNLDSVSIECMQLHNLDGDVSEWIEVEVEEEVVIAGSGDNNADGIVNILDAVRLTNHILNGGVLNDAQVAESDLNGDGGINILDIVGMVNIILEDE